MTPAPRVAPKWRPPLALVVGVVLAAVLALPLAGVFFFRLYENQLIRETEGELIAQSAVLCALYARDLEALAPQVADLGPPAPRAPKELQEERYRPIAPRLDLASDTLLPRRPEALPATRPASPVFVALGERLAPLLVETQKTTLAGFRLLDPQGVVIGGREETGLSLAHVEEIAQALEGRFASVMRLRISSHEPPPLYSASRGTSVRIFLAAPVILRGRVAGVVYLSRTPSNVIKHLYEERAKAIAASLAVVATAAGIGLLFLRLIVRPTRALIARTEAIAAGDREAIRPLAHHGTAEFAQLSQAFLDMAASLATRSDFVASFAAHVSHELKSPLTSIKGAAELLREEVGASTPGMSDEMKRKFLDNIAADAERLTAVVNRLREMAKVDRSPIGGRSVLCGVIAAMGAAFPEVSLRYRGPKGLTLGLSDQDAQIVVAHLVDNAQSHGATRLDVDAVAEGEWARIVVSDDGTGVSPANRERIFDNFFTTRRETGGTGMGLSIVRAMLRAHGGEIRLLESRSGAAFELKAPVAHADLVH